ncbi:hypothetical protein E2C01_014265 [Portunus trituberculatus]|uniref:Uncharacterized protein n=1 Tax=Portunus trituberculatus TaxID=210409 RepID=A0A5B7DIB4_PORTR|nr:hypothetical protein [Portunus trituberculatus]
MKVRRLMGTVFTILTPSVLRLIFYLEICVRLDHFIDIRKDLWRSEDGHSLNSLF